MTSVTEAPKASFRLGMLIYDTRYRSMTIQVIALILLAALLWWLRDNLITNLAAKGKDINFSFLWNRAGYDIDQQLIPYTNDSTHFRALWIGLLNTLVVAFFGCIFATIIGVFAGVLRLSKNWIVARLMTVYVEVFRNVPLLLWIILAYTVFTEVMPQINDFKVTQAMVDSGTQPAASMLFFDTVALSNRGTSMPYPMLTHPLGEFSIFNVPINFSLLAVLVVFIGSIFVTRGINRRAKVIQEATGIRPVTWWKNLAIIFLPTIVLLTLLGLHWDVPHFNTDENGVWKGFNFIGGFTVAHNFTALVIALSLYTGSYIAEAVRAGIMAVSRGQSEAAAALGLRQGRVMSLVVLPQALRVIVPPLISQYLNLTKNTTLGIAVGYLDLKGTLGGITMNQTGRELECMLLMMMIYLILSLLISSAMNVYNATTKLKER
ncbi:MAG: amino acid ABC transporter permease [Cypionkella sp.]|jgi:general L-amino acid transport system permease protein